MVNKIKLREEIKELNLSGKFLKGNLDLSDFLNLEKLDCLNNKLTSFDLGKNNQLKSLNLINNDFSEQDLSFLAHLIKFN